MSAGKVVPTIVVHGGAGLVAAEFHEAVVVGARAAAQAGREQLDAGGGCEAAVVAAVRVLEDCEVTNAGRGACMNARGQFEVDASIMRSRDGANGAIAAVPDLADAIVVAQAVMEHSPHGLLAGPGAVDFARERGVGNFSRDAMWTAKAQERFERARDGVGQRVGQADTVGAVAIDADGHLCVGCSTGGVLLKTPGRVGDSPLIGPGFFASPTLGAACATGVGEAIMKHVASFAVLQRVAQGMDPHEAAAKVCAEVATEPVGDANATCGIILLTPAGRLGLAHASPHMSWAVARGTDPIEAGLQQPLAPPAAGRL